MLLLRYLRTRMLLPRPDVDENLILLPLTYLGPIQYYSKFLLEGRFVVEQYDSYVKQTYRNRCVILGANGPVILTIPIKKKRGQKNLVKDIIIDYDTDWRRLHWRGIISAYNSSPFFEFYRDRFEPFYLKKYSFLVDYCFTLTKDVLNLMIIDVDLILSDSYIFPKNKRIIHDFRELIHPKTDIKEDDYFRSVTYQQVFSGKWGFIPNLSILDLLFNLGPEALVILKNSVKKA
jgi:hypothetical protein